MRAGKGPRQSLVKAVLQDTLADLRRRGIARHDRIPGALLIDEQGRERAAWCQTIRGKGLGRERFLG